MASAPPSKTERLREFYRRLASAPSAPDGESAFKLLEDTLNEVEDEWIDIPFNPDHWQSDGRLYPPQRDSVRSKRGPAV